jgi:hypothetical protein
MIVLLNYFLKKAEWLIGGCRPSGIRPRIPFLKAAGRQEGNKLCHHSWRTQAVSNVIEGPGPSITITDELFFECLGPSIMHAFVTNFVHY